MAMYADVPADSKQVEALAKSDRMQAQLRALVWASARENLTSKPVQPMCLITKISRFEAKAEKQRIAYKALSKVLLPIIGMLSAKEDFPWMEWQTHNTPDSIEAALVIPKFLADIFREPLKRAEFYSIGHVADLAAACCYEEE